MSRDLFGELKSLDEARSLLEAHFPGAAPSLEVEGVPLLKAGGRVLAQDVSAPRDVPGFRRSTVDGYAVRAGDTAGASEGLPAYLKRVGSVAMGEVPDLSLSGGEAAGVATGGMLPEGADAVVMFEYTDSPLSDELEVVRPVTQKENVIGADEDVARGQIVFTCGTHLRPSHVGVLSAMGFSEVPVWSRLRAVVFSSGDEVVPPGEIPLPGQVADMNGPTLTASLSGDGVEVQYAGILPDSAAAITAATREGLVAADLALISGGSSVGLRDVTGKVIDSLGPPGVLFHGVAMSPGKPIIAGKSAGSGAVFGLPGHPVSAQVVYTVLLRDLVHRLQGRGRVLPRPVVGAILVRSLAGPSGRTEYVRVRLKTEGQRILAEPILGKSGLLSTLARADGLVELTDARRGMDAGQRVEVILLDS